LLEDGRFYVRPFGFDGAWDEMDTEQRLEVFRNTVLSGIDPTRELDMEKILTAAEGGNYEVRALPDEEVNV
jgi:NDP-sugar pyrophosphorylase family protein